MNFFVHKRSFKKYVCAEYVRSCKKSESVGGDLGVWLPYCFAPVVFLQTHACPFVCQALCSLSACLFKWFRHVKFQCKYFFNSHSVSAPIYSFEDWLRCVGHWFVELLILCKYPAPPSLTNSTIFKKFVLRKKWMAGLVTGISGQIYIHSPSFDTCGF